MAARKLGGINVSSARKRRDDSCINEVNCARVGESCAACNNDWAWLRLLIGCVLDIIGIMSDLSVSVRVKCRCLMVIRAQAFLIHPKALYLVTVTLN